MHLVCFQSLVLLEYNASCFVSYNMYSEVCKFDLSHVKLFTPSINNKVPHHYNIAVDLLIIFRRHDIVTNIGS